MKKSGTSNLLGLEHSFNEISKAVDRNMERINGMVTALRLIREISGPSNSAGIALGLNTYSIADEALEKYGEF